MVERSEMVEWCGTAVRNEMVERSEMVEQRGTAVILSEMVGRYEMVERQRSEMVERRGTAVVMRWWNGLRWWNGVGPLSY